MNKPNIGTTEKKPLFKKVQFWVIIVIIILLALPLGTAIKNKTTDVPTANQAVEDEGYINLEKFNGLIIGMTYNEVVWDIGSEGDLVSQTEVAGVIYETYQWRAESGYGNAMIKFKDGMVYSKSQHGLE